MNKQEFLKQIEDALRQGKRESAKKRLADFLMKHPENEQAWMIMARAVESEKQKKDCYERVIKINPKNVEAKKELVRMEFPGHTYDPQRGIVAETPKHVAKRFKFFTRSAFMILAVLFALVGVTFAIAKANPDSQLAKMLPSLPSVDLQKYNLLQYNSPEEMLIRFAKDAAKNGMEGAPPNPGYSITPALDAGRETLTEIEKAMPEVGAFSSITVTEYQATSVAALILSESPDLPARDAQVYFQNDQILVWFIVDGDGDSTSALVTGSILVNNGVPSFRVDSAQVGRDDIPSVLFSQVQTVVEETIFKQMREQYPGIKVDSVYIYDGGVTIELSR